MQGSKTSLSVQGLHEVVHNCVVVLSFSFYENYNPTGAVPMYSTNQSFPVVSYTDVLTVIYYDDYKWTVGVPSAFGAFDNSFNSYFNTPSNTVYPYPQDVDASNDTRGLITGTITKSLNDAPVMVQTTFYDDKARVIRVKSENYFGGCDITTLSPRKRKLLKKIIL